jgi:hypothetical protein
MKKSGVKIDKSKAFGELILKEEEKVSIEKSDV